MNAILIFPTAFSAELKQLRSEVASHLKLIDASATALEQSLTGIASHESDIARRMNALRQRLALLA